MRHIHDLKTSGKVVMSHEFRQAGSVLNHCLLDLSCTEDAAIISETCLQCFLCSIGLKLNSTFTLSSSRHFTINFCVWKIYPHSYYNFLG